MKAYILSTGTKMQIIDSKRIVRKEPKNMYLLEVNVPGTWFINSIRNVCRMTIRI
jgi:hypothetical protein